MKNKNSKIDELLELANQYPSPHNGQPIRLKQTGESSFDVYFEKERGLQATEISYIFSFVSMGVFIEHMKLAAQAFGHDFEHTLLLPKAEELRGKGAIKFASGSLSFDAGEKDPELLRTLRSRQTSRKKYSEGITELLAEEIIGIATDQKMSLSQLNSQQAKQAIWLNQRAVFDDMFDEPVRQELNHWLRYNQQEKQAKKDGLSYDCMELNGRLIKYIVDHPRILRKPGISGVMKQYYLRTMTDSSDIFYMLAPFATEQEAFDVGTVIMRIWQAIAAKGYYLHPFGTIMSNQAAHQDFLEMADVKDENRAGSYLVFIFKSGKSKTPVRSLRLPYQEHLIMDENYD
jgi:hypothetical protein